MKNQDRYKTAKERAKALLAWCSIQDKSKCQTMREGYCFHCAMKWLELEAEGEKPLPCPFCGGPTIATTNFGGLSWVLCDGDCGYSSPRADGEAEAISAHNCVARKCIESEVKE